MKIDSNPNYKYQVVKHDVEGKLKGLTDNHSREYIFDWCILRDGMIQHWHGDWYDTEDGYCNECGTKLAAFWINILKMGEPEQYVWTQL